ncbi:MAG: tRNA epoxyqueuosine(34) reductase QueG [Verrucomicrobiota bacterium]|nr:tRNA epoxyqueuosine(34) reductase QueG [Verrucomicrobiota bacterium]
MSTEIRTQLIALAHELGFDLCRFARADAPEHAQEFREWLDADAAGEMEYLARNSERRCDPQQVLPGAKSVIALAMNYFQGERPTTHVTPSEGSRHAAFKVAPRDPSTSLRSGRDDGRIARYAWGDDYHGLIERRLRKLDAFLQTQGGAQKCYVDTGPMLERDHAATAGIGWHGKSTMLLNRELGTWFFLAEILTTLEFEPDAPQANRCGSCVRCIEACPTGAITAPHQVDARRCISYLTIELKGSIPVELRPLMGDRIYGCDDCLDACPWNRFAKISRETAFQLRPEIAAMPLRDYLALDDARFRELFRGSPIKRTKRRGLLRNVCVALGNIGSADDLPALQRAAEVEEELIAEHARWAIAQIRARES